MNDAYHNTVNERMLMRLVDGELSIPEQHHVLTALETAPGGWRRCAMAFLEDQALQQQLGQRSAATRHPPIAQPGSGQTGVTQTKGGDRPSDSRLPRIRQGSQLTAGNWTRLLSLAATIMLAFAMGWWVESTRQNQQSNGPNLVDSVNLGDSSRLPATTPATGTRPDGHLAGSYYVNDSRFWDQESVIPADVRQSLQRVGADIRRERGVIPVTLSDGRRISVPYEDVQLVPVSNRSY